MLTLQNLKQITEAPNPGQKIPTAKALKEKSIVMAKKYLRGDAQILVFENGYALYQVSRFVTVFSIHTCRDYQYDTGNAAGYIPEQYFMNKEWYIRLVLEGEDRLNRNQEVKEQGRTISYNALSEPRDFISETECPFLEEVVRKEMVKELLSVLTKQQHLVIIGLFFFQKTQKELSQELHISVSAVSRISSRALQRIRRKCPDKLRNHLYLRVGQ